MIEDPRVSDDTPERARWETWEGGLHDWSDVWPPDDGLSLCPDCEGYGSSPDGSPCPHCNGDGLVGGAA